MMRFVKNWLVIAPVLLGLATYAGTANGQPNIVLIMVDDLSPADHPDDPEAADLYRNMNSVYTNIGMLAAEGMGFRTMYAAPVCTASRVELLTGQYGFNNGYFSLRTRQYSPLPTSPYYDIGAKQSLARMLRAKGYRTGVVGKWGITGDPNRGLAYEAGFEDYYILGNVQGAKSRYWSPTIIDNGFQILGSPDDYGPDMFADWAVDFINAHKAERFFLYYPMVLVHVKNRYEGYEDVPDGIGGRIPGSLRSNVAYVDLIVGRIVEAVRDAGVENDTMIIFTADNGTNYNHHVLPPPGTFPGFKANPTENGARVPFIVKYPGVVPAGIVSRQVTDFVDIAATVHDYTGPFKIPISQPLLDGVSLRLVLEDSIQSRSVPPLTPHKTYAFSYRYDKRVIRDDQWVYEDIDENGDGDLFFCGNTRRMVNCALQEEPFSQAALDKIDELKQVLLSYPPPDVIGQELIPPP